MDDYAPVVAGLDNDIDQIEATVFSGAVAPTERIYSLRRQASKYGEESLSRWQRA